MALRDITRYAQRPRRLTLMMLNDEESGVTPLRRARATPYATMMPLMPLRYAAAYFAFADAARQMLDTPCAAVSAAAISCRAMRHDAATRHVSPPLRRH